MSNNLPSLQQNTSDSQQSENVSTLVSSNILDNLKNSITPKTFGDQIKNYGNQQIIRSTSDSIISKLYKEKTELIAIGIKLDIDHQKKLFNLEEQNTPNKKVVNGEVKDIPPKLTDEEYQRAKINEEINYTKAKAINDAKKKKNQDDIDNFYKDPFKNQKDELKKLKDKKKKIQNNNKEERIKTKRNKNKAILQNNQKSLVSVITLLLTNKITDIISQNDKIKQLVDNTNNIIEKANISNDPIQLDNAKLLRDNTIKVIQSNENKIIEINKQIQSISLYVNIFNNIVNIISNIPILTSVGGVGIPVSLIIKFVKILDKANRILLNLSSFIPTIILSIQNAILVLENYKNQLLSINGILEASGIKINVNYGDLGTYKGFKFALKEENNPKFVVQGNKRHYAVAINKNNIEVLKSEYSFTLDPNDLIEQLKLIIDQKNLSA